MTTYLKNIAVPKKYEEHVDFANEHFGLNEIIKANHYHTPLRAELNDFKSHLEEMPNVSNVVLLCPCDWEFEDVINPLEWTEHSTIECSSCHRVFSESDLQILPELKQTLDTGKLDYFRIQEFNLSKNAITRPVYISAIAPLISYDNNIIIYNDAKSSDSKISIRISELRLILIQSSRKSLKCYYKLNKKIQTLVFNKNDNTFRKSVFLSPLFLNHIQDTVPFASLRNRIFVKNVNYENPAVMSVKSEDLSDDEFELYQNFMNEIANAKNIKFNNSLSPVVNRANISQKHIDIITALNAENVKLFNDATNIDLTKCLHHLSNLYNYSRENVSFDEPVTNFMLKLIGKKEQTSIKTLMKLSFPYASKSNIKKLIKWLAHMLKLISEISTLENNNAALLKLQNLEGALKLLSLLDDPKTVNQVLEFTSQMELDSDDYFKISLFASEFMSNIFKSKSIKGGYGCNKQLRRIYARMVNLSINISDNRYNYDYSNQDVFDGIIRHFDLLNSIKNEDAKKQLKRDFVSFLANQPIKNIKTFESNLISYYAHIKIQSPDLQKRLESNCVKSLNQTKEDIMKFESKSENVTFSIPKRGIEMLILGDILNICVGGRGYQEAVANNDIQIIVANHNQTNDKIVIEYDKAKNAIIQAKSKFNNPLYLIKNDELQRETFDYLRNLTPIVESYDLGKTLPTGFSFNNSRYDQNFIAPVNQEPQHHMEMPEFDVLDLPDLDLPF